MARGKFGDSVVSAVLVLSWGHADTHTHTHTQRDTAKRFTPATVDCNIMSF